MRDKKVECHIQLAHRFAVSPLHPPCPTELHPANQDAEGHLLDSRKLEYDVHSCGVHNFDFLMA